MGAAVSEQRAGLEVTGHSRQPPILLAGLPFVVMGEEQVVGLGNIEAVEVHGRSPRP